MGEEEQPRRGGLLGFFGLDTGQEALDAFLWTLPYMGMLVAGLAGLSWFVQTFTPIPVWVHVLAIGLAIVYFFFFLCRMRRMSQDAQEPIEQGPRARE